MGKKILLFLVLCSLCSLPMVAADEIPLGLWSGGVGELDPESGRWLNLFVQFDEAHGSTLIGHGALDDGSMFRGRIAGKNVSFSVKAGGKKVAFNGTLSGDTINGTCKLDGKSQPCVLIHEGHQDPAQLEAAAGLYSIDDDHRILLSKSFHLVYEDLQTGEVRALYAAGKDRFTAGPTVSIPRPIEFRVQLERGESGRVVGLAIERGDGQSVRARRCCEVRTEPFSFKAPDGITLRGTLYMPDRPGPLPGVLWVHGSGQANRSGAGSWPWFFTDQGFAFLAIDKRGVGESDGKYALPGGGHDNRPHMIRRSKDVRAGLQALAAHKDVREDLVGLVGVSQAGWVIPMAAADNPAVAFNVILSGGATQLSYESVFSRWADEDGSGVEGTPIEEVLARTRRHKPNDASFAPFIESMHGPGLWLYGGRDRSNPSELCIELLERIREDGGKDFTMHLFPNGNHGLMEARYGGAAEYPTLNRHVPGHYRIVADWLREKAFD